MRIRNGRDGLWLMVVSVAECEVPGGMRVIRFGLVYCPVRVQRGYFVIDRFGNPSTYVSTKFLREFQQRFSEAKQ